MLLLLIGCIYKGVFGGGVGIVCVCDVVIVISDVQFGLIEMWLGFILVIIGFYVFVCMGEGKVCCVFMFVWLFDVYEVKVLDLVVDVVDVDVIDDCIVCEIDLYLFIVLNVVVVVKWLVW